MADEPLDAPLPDRAHEQLRVELLAAVEAARANQTGVDDSYFLNDLLFSLVDSALAQIDELAARLTALEPAQPPEAP